MVQANFFTGKVFAVFLAEPISDFIAASVTVITFARQIDKILDQNLLLR
ncbi:MAG: hypothetical protein GX818_00830 [Tissierellia bacterium]|nr:hypothetical protein [Tissierellia bacterium]